MAPIPRVGIGPLPKGQTTIFPTATGALSVVRPTPPPRTSPKPKPTSQSKTILGRRLISGVNEQHVVQIFASFRLLESNGELRDREAASREIKDIVDEEVELDEYDYIPQR
jgi:hypothetical protein